MISVIYPRRFPFDFETLSEAGKWCTAFGRLEDHIKAADEMEPGVERESFIQVVLFDAYSLRSEWGDTFFPVKMVNWLRTQEHRLGLPLSYRLGANNSELASWRAKLLYEAKRVSK